MMQFGLEPEFIAAFLKQVFQSDQVEFPTIDTVEADVLDFLQKQKAQDKSKAFDKEVSKREHDFKKTHFERPTWCDWCNAFVWGLGKQGLQCTRCGYVCHLKCRELVGETGCNRTALRPRYKEQTELSAANAMKNALKSGYLSKEGGGIRNMKRRFFVLLPSRLLYFKSEKDSKPTGTIFLDGATVKIAHSKPPSIYVDTPGRTYLLVAEKEETELGSKAWLSAIKKAVVTLEQRKHSQLQIKLPLSSLDE
jgi:hypothetical protein